LRTIFDWTKKDIRIQELDIQSESPTLWDDPKAAGLLMQEREQLRKEKTDFQNLSTRLGDLSELLSLGVDDEHQTELIAEYQELEKLLSAWEWQTLMNGPYDTDGAILTLRSGAGGVDAQDWTEMLSRMYLRYAERKGFTVHILEESRGGEAGIKSISFECVGAYAYGFLQYEAGIHRLVRLSPFNSQSLRQTSFASLEVMPILPEEDQSIIIKDDEVRIDTFRSSGAGGQSVNKTESAVRITHLPTNIVVSCQNERSQLQNRESAWKMLRSKLATLKLAELAEEQAALRGEYKSAEWGNQIRSYVLHPYNMIKDHRTDTETADTGKVLDGYLDEFIESELRFFA
jgi:peptide chain release factor 2